MIHTYLYHNIDLIIFIRSVILEQIGVTANLDWDWDEFFRNVCEFLNVISIVYVGIYLRNLNCKYTHREDNWIQNNVNYSLVQVSEVDM